MSSLALLSDINLIAKPIDFLLGKRLVAPE